MGIHSTSTSSLEQTEHGVAEPEVLSCIHKLQEMWDGKRELLEEEDLESLKARGGHPTNNLFQISVNTLEQKPAKVRKCDGCNDRHMRELSLNSTPGNGEKEGSRASPAEA
jgi:hypothetical protein